MMHRPTRAQRGFAYIAAVIFLVVIAGISVALLRLTDTQQSTATQAILAARASLAARGGIEWAAHQLGTRCATAPGQSNNLTDFRNDAGFLVTVTCTFRDFDEGEDGKAGATLTKRIYFIDAVACNGSGNACPHEPSVTGAGYVERRRTATICLPKPGSTQPAC